MALNYQVSGSRVCSPLLSLTPTQRTSKHFLPSIAALESSLRSYEILPRPLSLSPHPESYQASTPIILPLLVYPDGFPWYGVVRPPFSSDFDSYLIPLQSPLPFYPPSLNAPSLSPLKHPAAFPYRSPWRRTNTDTKNFM
ncbi:hypothetical protein E2C01_084868 [Portunus trituberculatus]|uniref:Uncharacterized protein n=1 Tax=Portunus trituberculatus TaxID=210409 RepID=A0A5B7J551_PORTR|nr:hypothetical protein [Portunus trituberculatus]